MKVELKGRLFLVVDDNDSELRHLSRIISSFGGKWHGARSLAAGKKLLDEEAIDCVVCDIHLDQELLDGRTPGGIELLRYAKSNHPNVLLIATSGDPRIETYHEAAKAGAMVYLSKPVKNVDAFMIAYTEAMTKRFESRLDTPIDLPSYLTEIDQRYPDRTVISPEARRILSGVARHPENTLIMTGETGTGKEQMAKFVHRERIRNEGAIPFIAVNCATIDPSLATSLLFGHKKGAFSGAAETTNGYIGDSDGGILFLDEIHYLDMSCQQKLLRVLNDGKYERLGDTKTLSSRFQLITASTKDLKEEVKNSKFLIDLYMRIVGGIELRLLPLNERLHEVPALVGIFLSENSLDLTEDEFRRLCKKLQSYNWHGNIRQLFKFLQSWLVNAQCQGLRPSIEFLPYFHGSALFPDQRETLSGQEGQCLDQSEKDASDALLYALRNNQNLERTVETLEKFILEKALFRNNSIGDTASALGLSRSTLDLKRKKYGIEKL